MIGETFEHASYWSNTYDVFGWNDAHEDDGTFRVIASFENRDDAHAYVCDHEGEHFTVRPPAQQVKDALAYLLALSGGVNVRHSS